jgi:hypothetical protein
MAKEVSTLPSTSVPRAPTPLPPTELADHLRHWGFLAHPDLPDGPGPSFLLVGLRPVPTLQHYDPEAVDYWATAEGRGVRRTITHGSPMPRSEDFAWGLIRLVDRLGVSNEYLTFGGRLDAAAIDQVVVAAFVSPAPLLTRGGDCQGRGDGADAVGAFFGRLMVAVDYQPGFEAELDAVPPLVRYAAFIQDADARQRHRGLVNPADDRPFGRLVAAEAVRLRATAPTEWAAGAALLNLVGE